MNHEQWLQNIERIRSELGAWGIATDHLSDHELNTAVNAISEAFAATGCASADVIHSLGALKLAMDKSNVRQE